MSALSGGEPDSAAGTAAAGGDAAEIAAAVEGELRLMDPAVRGSRALAGALLAPEFVEVGASGRRWTYEEMLAALPGMAGGAEHGPRYRPSDLTGAVLAPGVVHLTYETVIEGLRARRSSLWRRRPGCSALRLYYHQATPVPGGARSAVAVRAGVPAAAGGEALTGLDYTCHLLAGAGVLNLNVFTPVTGTVAGLPVLVWIHGGGYVAGSAASPWYDGSSFNRDGVVLVSLGYRLGVEGFLHLENAPDNRGVRDWIAALEWVRDNISRFGGDPAKVAVAGQSAGGGAVQTLLAAQGLFCGALSVSGAVMRPDGPEVGRAVARLFTARTGVPATAAALRGLGDDELHGLQDRMSTPGPDREGLPPLLSLAPFADGELIPEPVLDALNGR